MRIAFVSTMPLAPWQGSDELWADAAEEALAAGHEVHVFLYECPQRPPRVEALARAGATIHLRARHDQSLVRHAMLSGARRTSHWPLPTRLSAFRALRDVQPDVVCVSLGHVYSSVAENPALVRWLLSGAAPYVLICQSASDDRPIAESDRRRTRAFLDRATRVAFVAERDRRTTERQLAVSLGRAVVLREPVKIDDRSRVPWPVSERAELATVARLDVHAKGQDVLFEALTDERWRDRDWRLTLYGAGDDEHYLRRLAAHYDIRARIAMIPAADDVRAIWSRSHLLVLPSRADGTPRTLVEAMLCGRPAVVTDVGGHREWVAEGETGWIAPAATASEVGAALDRAFKQRPRWEEMGARAHDVASELFDENPGRSLLSLLTGSAPVAR